MKELSEERFYIEKNCLICFNVKKRHLIASKKQTKNIKIEGEKYDRRIKSAAHGCKADKKGEAYCGFYTG